MKERIRPRKKEKRLDAICEKVYNSNRLVQAESNEGNTGLESEEVVRRSARVRKAPAVLDASPLSSRKKQRVDDGGVSLRRKSERGKKKKEEEEEELEKESVVVESGDGEGKSGWKSRLRSRGSDVSSETRETRTFWRGQKLVFDEVKGESKDSKKEEVELVVDGKTDGDDNAELSNEGIEEVVANDSTTQLLEEEKSKMMDTHEEETDKRTEQVEGEKTGEERDMEEVGNDVDEVGNGESHADKDACTSEPGKRQFEEVDVVKVDKPKGFLTDKLHKSRVREGRRCGLCGRASDGRPPKRLVKDYADSDNEGYGGSSSEEANYDTWDGFGDEPGWLGRLLGPIHDRFGIAGVWVHHQCAVWSPEVYFAGLGCLKNVRAALFRGRALKCSRCGRPGATIGCRVDRCPKTYHLPCGRADSCIFDQRKFLIACVDHRHLFQPHGNQYLHRIKKLKAKKLKLEMRKHSHDAWRNDCEAEEKWLENCGEDEEFLKREGKRLHRDILRIAPVYIGGPSSNNENLYQGWESVAGLQDVIQCMKEVVLLPLLYPEFFTSLGLTPPRGVLLHGYPGTGKTLVVRALIGSCARGDRRIAYFARKGADCLGKYVGDAERQLRLLFQVAEKSQPSIIFFDEIDGLAPCRTRQQDQTHNSVVSTLLALMDGLKSRGSVIVIGATNRPDAVDPALRRPGRFDREIYFPLPSVEDRASILSVHTRKWPRPVSGSLLKFVAQKTAGFAGADLQALCTQAAMIALKRNCDLQKLMSAAERKAGNCCRLPPLSFPVEEKDWLDALSHAPQPCSRREAGMAANDAVSSPLHLHLAPCLLQPLSHLLVSLYCDERVLLPPFLYKAAKMIETVMISAMEKISMSNGAWLSHLPDYMKEADIARQIERGLSSVGFLTGASISSNSDVLNDDTVAHKQFKLHRPSQAGPSTLVKNGSSLLGRKSGFRVLITGHPKSGQRHLASCLLHGFVGCVEIQKVDLATISQEGHGDVAEGMTQILLKCLSKDLCVVYMPRIDLWAVEMPHEVDDKEHDISGNTFTLDDTARRCDAKRIASPLWNTFMEQVDSTHLSASLTILATSEVSIQDLPHKICKFFTSDVLKVRDSIPSQHTLPRFIVQTDGNFDCDAVINSSALELSCSVVQHYVQLLHEKTHTVNLLEEYRDGSILEGITGTESHDNGVVSDITGGDASCGGDKTREHRNGDEQCLPMSKTAGHQDDEVKLCHPPDAGPRVVSNNRAVKGKSSLLLAISSFGYQILRYPHFSELCWATSKLKDGPCTDISGPWKGWPFNSCMIRPSNSLEKVALGCSSTNHKNKEYTGEVRGLIAVGLLAYRGVYTSVREVAFEVRKVLELLAEQVSAKIVGGKDRYCFLRLLSQVAYLEDMVNSWAYTLQSLERDSQMTFSNPRQTVLGHPDDHLPSECNPVGSEPKVFPKNSNEVQVHEQNPSVPTEGNGFARSQKGVANLGLPNSEARITISGDSSQDMASLAYAAPGSLLPLTSENTLTMQNKINNAENSVSENHISIGILHGSFESSKQANGLAKNRPILHSEDENSIDREMNLVSNSSKGTGSEHPTCLSKGLPSEDCTHNPDEIVGAVNFAQKKNNGASTVSKPTCLYRCCPDCLYLVYILIQKMLIHERDAFGSCWTVEDVHDIVASWSVNLLSAVRELINLKSVSENMIDENIGNICACFHIQLKETSRHKSSALVVPLECHFHSEKSVTEKTTACTNSLSELGLNFFFRDNILITSEMGMDALLHCKFESLCLGTLIGYLSTIKNPLD